MPTSLAFSPDGQLLALGWYGGLLSIWKLDQGIELVRVMAASEQDRINSVIFSPDGQAVATSSFYTHLWNTTTLAPLSLAQADPLGGFDASLEGFTPDGHHMLAGDFEATLFSLETGMPIHTYGGEGFFSIAAALSPDGVYVASANDFSEEPALVTWVTATGAEVWRKQDVGRYVTRVKFSPDGRLLAVIEDLGTPDLRVSIKALTIRNARTGRLLYQWTDPAAGVCFDFSPDSQLVVVCNSAGGFTLWDLKTGHQLAAYPLPDPTRMMPVFTTLSFSPDGTLIVASGPYADAVTFWGLAP